MKTFKFMYRDEFLITIESQNKTEAKRYITNNGGRGNIVDIKIVGDLWETFLDDVSKCYDEEIED